MKLYSIDFSPYSARVRMLIYAKHLPVQVVTPPGGLGSEEQRELAPLGKLPILELDNGQRISESIVIMEYLEEYFPEVSLMPADSWGRALVRMQATVSTNYLTPVLLPMFLSIKYPESSHQGVSEYMDELCDALSRYEALLAEQVDDLLAASSLTIGDCALVPVSFFAEELPKIMGHPLDLGAFPLVAQWWQKMQQLEPVIRVIYELQRGLQTYLADLDQDDLS